MTTIKMNTQDVTPESINLGELPMDITLEEYEVKEAHLLAAGFDKMAIGQALYISDYNLNEAFWRLEEAREGEKEKYVG